MAKPKPKTILTLTVEKMLGETEQQYHGWLLYCETGSLAKALEAWDKVGQSVDEVWMKLASKLGTKPAHTTIGRWAKKYRWVERTALRLEEELAEMKYKTDRFRAKRKYLVTDILMTKMTKLQRQAKSETSTVAEVRSLWEMHRTEFDETTSKSDVSHHINEAEQYPPTEDEKKLGREIDELIKQHYDKQR